MTSLEQNTVDENTQETMPKNGQNCRFGILVGVIVVICYIIVARSTIALSEFFEISVPKISLWM
jgi:hypothetical protein